MVNILFVCKFNRFRSRTAEAYFNKNNPDTKRFKARSAGIFKGNPVDNQQAKVAKRYGLNIIGPTKGISSKLLAWTNILVVVADDVPKALFKDNPEYGKQTVYLNIKDERKGNGVSAEDVIKAVIKKVDALTQQLEEGKW